MANLTTKTNVSFLNSDHVISNIEKLIQVHNNNIENLSNGDRKKKLFEILNALQNSNIPYETDNIIIDFENEKLLNHLVADGMIDREDTYNQNHLFNPQDQNIIRDNIEKALRLIKMLQPELHFLMTQLIGTIVCFRKKGYGGGSVSSLIGAIWFNPLAKWSVVDYAEALYHEFIHNSLFLDDMVNSIFPDTKIITTEEALVTSTILKIKRPLDRSFHSAGVAIGLMHFYHMLSDYKKILSFKEPLRITITEMNDKQKYLGEQGKEILREMNNFINNMDFDSISESLKFRHYNVKI
ncbi:MAG: HEXXH motif-containing putative peptide modification protein [Ectobacillus sp.]